MVFESKDSFGELLNCVVVSERDSVHWVWEVKRRGVVLCCKYGMCLLTYSSSQADGLACTRARGL